MKKTIRAFPRHDSAGLDVPATPVFVVSILKEESLIIRKVSLDGGVYTLIYMYTKLFTFMLMSPSPANRDCVSGELMPHVLADIRMRWCPFFPRQCKVR